MQIEFLCLVLITSRIATHEFKDIVVFRVELHDSEILSLVHKLFRVASLSHIDTHEVLSPDGTQSTPTDGHGIALLLVACTKQPTWTTEYSERINLEILAHIELIEIVVLFRWSRHGIALFATEEIVTDILPLELVLWCRHVLWITDGNDVQRNEVLWQMQNICHRLATLFHRIDTEPNSTEVEPVGCKENVFRYCRRILYPILASITFQCLIHVTTHHNA